MYEFLRKHFIKNYQNVKDTKVRERYGIVISIFCIICNILLAGFKVAISLITNSQSIMADALNNLSDSCSNIVTLYGFKLSNKHPDAEHPYGYGRLEYIAGLFIGLIIMVVGGFSLYDAINSLINKEELSFSYLAIIILIIPIIVKIIMGLVNKKAGEDIDSEVLLATSKDSFNDVILTIATLVSLLVYKFFNINIDGIVGCIVNLYVIKSGLDIVLDLINVLLGKAPDKELIHKIEEDVLSNKEILDIHDIVYHDYGPGSKFLTFHAEVDANSKLTDIHEEIDILENFILGKYGILTTIHIDPVVLDDPEVFRCKSEVLDAVNKLNPDYSIHDFRLVKYSEKRILIFDLNIPLSERKDHGQIRSELMKLIKEKDSNFYPSFKIEHNIIDD